jgi:hypothetical protein
LRARQLIVVLVTTAIVLVWASAASADVFVHTPKSRAFCTDRIRVGVWYQSYSAGPRAYSISVYNPSSRRIVYRRGLASTTWRYFSFRPIALPGVRFGFGTYKTVYRSPGFPGPLVFRTDVLCGE